MVASVFIFNYSIIIKTFCFIAQFPTKYAESAKKHELHELTSNTIACIWLLGQIFKIHKKSHFDRNQLKLSTQHKYMYMYQKM